MSGTDLLEVSEGDKGRPRAGIEHRTPQGFDFVFSYSNSKGQDDGTKPRVLIQC